MHINISSVITPANPGANNKAAENIRGLQRRDHSPATGQLSTRLGERLGMRRRTMVFLTGFMLTLTLAGCASAPPTRMLSTKVPTYAALPNGHNPMNPDQISPMYVTMASGSEENIARAMERKHGHALNMLSLSGGGQNGAFGAGFLSDGARAVSGLSLISSPV